MLKNVFWFLFSRMAIWHSTVMKAKSHLLKPWLGTSQWGGTLWVYQTKGNAVISFQSAVCYCHKHHQQGIIGVNNLPWITVPLWFFPMYWLIKKNKPKTDLAWWNWFKMLSSLFLFFFLLWLKDWDARGPPETATRFPAGSNAPAPVSSTHAYIGANAHSHANAEPTANAAPGVQGFVISLWHRFPLKSSDNVQGLAMPRSMRAKMNFLALLIFFCMFVLQEQSLLQPPTLQLLNGMGPLGRRASDGGANIQLHAQLLKRPRGPSPLVTSPVSSLTIDDY